MNDGYVCECCYPDEEDRSFEEDTKPIKTHDRYSFSDETSNYISFCRYLEESLMEIYDTSGEDMEKIIDLFFTKYERNTKEWYMKEELERITKTKIGCRSDYIRNIDWLSENSLSHHLISNPIERAIIYITTFITHDLDEKFYDINELQFGVKFTDNENEDVSVRMFLDEDEMHDYGYTNKASDYLEHLRKFAEMKMKENNNKEN